MGGRLNDRIPGLPPVRLFLFDLVDQDHRIAGNHAGEREHSEQRHKAHGLVRKEQSPDDPNEAQRGHAEHQENAVEALQLDHQYRENQNEHQWQSGGDRHLRLVAFLNCAAKTDMVPTRQAGT